MNLNNAKVISSLDTDRVATMLRGHSTEKHSELMSLSASKLGNKQQPLCEIIIARLRANRRRRTIHKPSFLASNKRYLELFHLALVFSALVLIAFSSSTCASEQKHKPEDTGGQATNLAEQTDKYFDGDSPSRQYFKINVSNGQAGKRPHRQSTRRATNSVLGSEKTKDKEPSKQKISNANLKKLLAQSLMKSTNGSFAGIEPKSSNFKFVFIQRATASPSNKSAKKSHQSSVSTATATATTAPKQSLAASVSKQLASSLMYSAPSLSSLASQLVSQSLDSNSISSETKKPTTASSGLSSSKPIEDLTTEQDTKRLQTISSPSVVTESIRVDKKKSAGRRGPSKIYNLPVKFVANGQPNNVVFSTIRQHFATIKKIQAAAKAATSGQQQVGKRRKQPNEQKLKGSNSRLIYLPLKYLSNARPNKILTAKASHKSGQ